MKTLAIETSSKICGVCILDNDTIIDKSELNNGLTHSESLMPLIKDILNKNNLKLSQIDAVVCDIGPGSFTGIRIGVSTAMAFVDALNMNYTGVSSLEALAYNVNYEGLICSIIDAKNDSCYFALYNFQNNCYEEIIPPTASSIDEMFKTLNNFDKTKITFVGDGAITYKENIKNNVLNSTFIEDNFNIINTYNLALAGFKKLTCGNTLKLSPLYLKKPQAQRQLEAKLVEKSEEKLSEKLEEKLEEKSEAKSEAKLEKKLSEKEKIKIEKMELSDLELISNNLNNDFDDFWNYNVFKQELLNKNSIYYVAKDEQNKIVGFAGILIILDEANITNIVTKKANRNQGIGSLLLEKLISEATQKNLSSITLEVNEHNQNAIKLYEKFGFKNLGTRKKYYNNTDNAIIMTLSIKPAKRV